MPEGAPDLSIVLLNWNGARFLEQTLPTVFALTGVSCEVVFVDNGSSDDSRRVFDALAARHPSVPVRRVLNDGNAGASRGRNQGAAAAGGRFLWFLDNDIRVEPDAAARLLRVLDGRAGPGAACPFLARCHEEVRPLSVFVGVFGILQVSSTARLLASAGPRPVLYPSCAALMIRRDWFHEVGGFDEGFLYGLDDNDLGIRSWILGGPCHLVPAARCEHLGDAPSPALAAFRHRNFVRLTWLLLARNIRLPHLAWLAPAFLGWSLASSLLTALRTGRPRAAIGWLEGLLGSLPSWPAAWRHRRALLARAVLREKDFLRVLP